MADVNITNCKAVPKNCAIPVSQDSVSFHAADATYTLNFSTQATFGTSSATIPQGTQPTSLTVQQHVSTGYCISGPGCPSSPPCPPPPGGAEDGDPYEITIGSPIPKPKPKVKVAAKRAADVKPKAKGKPKPKPKALPTKKPAVKAKETGKNKPAVKAKKKR